MCKQKDAPDPVINTCNGRNCGDTFTGPNRPNKRSVNPHLKGQQKILHSLLFDSSLRMYYSVTNFGRTTSSFATTCNYDEAPLDEYGLPRETKWGHLRDLHAALRLSKKALLRGVTSAQKLGEDLEVKCIMPCRPESTKSQVVIFVLIELARTSLPFRKDVLRVPQVSNLAVFNKPITLKAGLNQIAPLGATVGFTKRCDCESLFSSVKDSGSYMKHRLAGAHNVAIQGLNTRTIDLSKNGWGHKAYFDAPEGDAPVALELSTMAKGMAWINGKSID
ncbi:hypothetical protein AAG906_015873 [Vitis piasezkii]